MRLALGLAVLLLLPLAPLAAFAAPATPAAPASHGPLAVWLRSDGRAGAGSVDRVRACDGTAPLVNTCTLEGLNTGSWQAGFFVVPTPLAGIASASLLSGQVRVYSPEDPANAAVFACDLADAAVLAHTFRSWPAYTCATLRTAKLTGSTVRADFHVGAWDPSLLVAGAPATNGVEAGVGQWTGFLTTLFE